MAAPLATITGYHGLITAIRARKESLGMSDKDLDEICNWPGGTISKFLARGAKKTLGPLSMGKILRGLGLDLIAVENPERTAQLREVFTPREEGQVRHNDVLAAGKHPVVVRELSRSYIRKLASLGGKARAQSLSPRKRKSISRRAALARWNNANSAKSENAAVQSGRS